MTETAETIGAAMSEQYTSAFHKEMRRYHDLIASTLTANDAATFCRRTLHEHAAAAHERAANGRETSEAAMNSSRRAGIDPLQYGQGLASFCCVKP